MKVCLDDKLVFECLSLKVDGWQVEYFERKVGGLNGTGIKNLGRKKRPINLILRSREISRERLRQRRDELLAMGDGQLHVMWSDTEGVFANVLVDKCKVGEVVAGGGSVSCEFEVTLVQVM